MAYDKIVDSTQLNADLTSIADAIRFKGSTSAALSFPNGFISAISDISGGTDTSDATLASGSQMLSGITAYARGSKYTGTIDTYAGSVNSSAGTIPYYSGSYEIAPSTVSQSFPTAMKIMSEDLVVQAMSGGNYDNFLIATGASIGSVYDTATSCIGYCGFFKCSTLTGIEMTAAEWIGSSAFEGCSGLIEASFPTCVTLSAYAFYSCRQLKSINLTMCERIDSFAFAGCAIESVSLPLCSTIGESAFYNCDSLSEIVLPRLETVPTNAFRHNDALSHVSLNIASSIGGSAFLSCMSLMSVYLLSNSVCTLATMAFNSTPISSTRYTGEYGSIYVPASLVDAYKSATNWSVYSDRITAYVE